MTAVRLHVASAGNEFMSHIAGIFADGFRADGVACEVVVDGFPLDSATPGTLDVVVAPHEFFPLHFLRHRPTIELPPTLASAAVLNVEQPGSQWFDVAWEFVHKASLVFDISVNGVVELERRGVQAIHTPLGYVPSLAGPGSETPASTRPIDVMFFGAGSERREAFFARHAQFFESIRAELHLASAARPAHDGTPGYLWGSGRLRRLSQSRIVLGVHSNARDYFEQHRALLALAGGALLVTETSRHTVPLQAGRDFVAGPLDELPSLCRHYLDRPAELDRIARAGQTTVQSSMPVGPSCRAMLEAAGASRPSSASPAEQARRDALRERIAESARRRRRGEAQWTTSQNALAGGAPPAVSVVVTAYNYERFLPRCLDSVAAATPPPGGVEIIVVDDASTDGSAEAAEDFMAAAGLPVQVIRKGMNTGLSDARNVGFESARGAYVFVLDADNWIYPSCLEVLHAAVAGSGHAAAYGVIARVDDETGEGTGLLSARAWDPRALLEGPYIDAMAMLDRQIVRSVGGYSTDLLEWGVGWEDYDLWLSLARAGHSCLHVPQVVAAYRDHRGSMLRVTNRRSHELARHFRVKFADLISRYPGLDTYFAFPTDDEAGLTAEEREIRQLRAHQTALETQIADIYRSKSWKLTAPLRAVLGWRDRGR